MGDRQALETAVGLLRQMTTLAGAHSDLTHDDVGRIHAARRFLADVGALASAPREKAPSLAEQVETVAKLLSRSLNFTGPVASAYDLATEIIAGLRPFRAPPSSPPPGPGLAFPDKFAEAVSAIMEARPLTEGERTGKPCEAEDGGPCGRRAVLQSHGCWVCQECYDAHLMGPVPCGCKRVTEGERTAGRTWEEDRDMVVASIRQEGYAAATADVVAWLDRRIVGFEYTANKLNQASEYGREYRNGWLACVRQAEVLRSEFERGDHVGASPRKAGE